MTGQLQRRTRGRALQALRHRILTRDCGLCQACIARGMVTVAVEMDHIVGIAKGGTDDDSNLQMLCLDCHADKSAADEGKQRRARVRIGADGWPVDNV